MKTLIIGGGELGQAWFNLFRENKKEVFVWDIHPQRNLSKRELNDLYLVSDFVFLCIPARAVNEICQKLKDQRKFIICFSKGLDLQNGQNMAEILANNFPKEKNYALYYGPMIAEELTTGGAGIFATHNPRLISSSKALFWDMPIFLKFSDDLLGVAWSGVFKNIYSILLGLIDTLNLNLNLRAFLINQSLLEMERLMKELGGQTRTIWDLSGLADFLATSGSDYSSNYSFGQELGLKGFSEIKAEGFFSFNLILKRLNNLKEYPLLDLLNSLLMNSSIDNSIIQVFFDNYLTSFNDN